MNKRLDPERTDADNPELDDAWFARAQRFDELPTDLQAKLHAVSGLQKAPTKERITIRLSSEVVARFRATGPGWQTRMDAALKDWLRNHAPE